MIKNSNTKKFLYKKSILIFLFLSSFFYQPVYAYAGPGVAIGALIVFITIILTFFASFFFNDICIHKKNY